MTVLIFDEEGQLRKKRGGFWWRVADVGSGRGNAGRANVRDQPGGGELALTARLACPTSPTGEELAGRFDAPGRPEPAPERAGCRRHDRKSTRLNSSHTSI